MVPIALPNVSPMLRLQKDQLVKSILNAALALTLIAGSAASPVLAKKHSQTRYQNNGRYYNSLAACQASKSKSSRDGTIVGAATAGIGAAVLGANLGETALIAGGGALVGNQLGKAKSC